VVITLIAAAWLRWMAGRGHLKVWHVWVNGTLYLTYLVIALA
jgi:cation:H+ antiporter